MEESYIYDTSRSCSGLLDFGIKELCKNIGRPVYGEVQDTIMVFCQSRNNNLETFESGSVDLAIAFCRRLSLRILMSILGESHPQGMWQGISFLQVWILGEKNLSQVLLFPKPFSRGLNSKYRERASSCLKESPFEKTNGKYVFPLNRDSLMASASCRIAFQRWAMRNSCTASKVICWIWKPMG